MYLCSPFSPPEKVYQKATRMTSSDLADIPTNEELLAEAKDEMIVQLLKEKKEVERQLEKMAAERDSYKLKYEALRSRLNGDVPPEEEPVEKKKGHDLSFLWHSKGAETRKALDCLYKILKSAGRKAEVCRQLFIWERHYFNFGRFPNHRKAELINQFAEMYGYSPFTDEDFKKNWRTISKPSTTKN